MVAPLGPGVAARFWAKVERGPGCWLWTAGKAGTGYGSFHVRGSGGRWKTENAHAVAFALARGLVPEGLELDHLCRTPACVRPSHLEAVTHAENVRRALPTRCIRGHVLPQGPGRRRCPACEKTRDRTRCAKGTRLARTRCPDCGYEVRPCNLNRHRAAEHKRAV